MNGINVLSLFDGMSCGHIALDRAGIKVNQYFASEIDRYAIQVTMANYPDTIQLGDVRNVTTANLPKIDLIAFGSPCQGFSFAGKQLNFKDPRSALFFEAVRLLKEIKPKYFLMENVIMKEEYKNAISEILGELYPECVQQKGLFSEGRLEPLQINSALVSAQNRDRLYWTNIPVKGMPADKGIMLKDIIDGDTGIKNNGEYQIKNDKSQCLDANYWKGADNHGQRTMVTKNTYHEEGEKSVCLDANYFKGIHANQKRTAVMCGAMRGRYLVDGKRADDTVESMAGLTQQRIDIRDDGKTNTLTTVQKDNLVIEKILPESIPTLNNILESDGIVCMRPERTEHAKEIRKQYELGLTDERRCDLKKLGPRTDGKTNTLTTVQKDNLCIMVGEEGKLPSLCTGSARNHEPKVALENMQWRKLTVAECCKLQTVDPQYIANGKVSNSQAYKMLGNGWTVDVIAWIFSFIKGM